MPDQKQSILIGAAISLVLSTSYLSIINCICCAGYIAAGLATVWHYTDAHRVTLESGRGAVMGMLAAVVGAFLAIFLNYILYSLGLSNAGEVIGELMIQQFGASMSPEQLEQFEAAQNQEIGFLSFFFQGLIWVVMGAIFGAIGGAIGAAIFKKGDDLGGAAATTPPVTPEPPATPGSPANQ